MAFKPTTKTTPDIDEVIFFTKENYSGEAYSSIIGDNIQVSESLNDKLHSVKIGLSAKVTLIRDFHFSGPTQEINEDIPKILLGGPGSGLSCFIVLPKKGKHIAKFSFKDKTKENRSLTLKSSNFNPTDEISNPGVTIPNLNATDPLHDPNSPRIFTILDDSNTETLPATTSIYVRKENGIYEPIGALILVYLSDSKKKLNTKIVKIKKYVDYDYGNLTFNTEGNLINFTWEEEAE